MAKTRIFGHLYLPEGGQPLIENVWFNFQDNNLYIEARTSNPDTEKWPILIGKFNDIYLSEVTFVNCESTGYNWGDAGILKSIRFQYALGGKAIPKKNQLFFTKVKFNLPALAKWAMNHEFALKDEGTELHIPKESLLAECELEEFKLKIILNYHKDIYPYDAKITKRVTGEIEFTKPSDYLEIKKTIDHLKKFVLLITNLDPEVDRVGFWNPPFVWKLISAKNHLNENQFHLTTVIGYDEMSENLSASIKSWYEKEKIGPFVDLLLEKSNNTEMSFTGHFLNLCTCFEIFSSKFKKSVFPTSEENKVKFQELEEFLSENSIPHDKWILSKKGILTSPSFKERLHSFKPKMEHIAGETFSYDFDGLITKIVQTRNHLVHTGHFKNKLTPKSLFLVTFLMEFTLRLELMELIDIYPKEMEGKKLIHAKNSLAGLAFSNEYDKENEA